MKVALILKAPISVSSSATDLLKSFPANGVPIPASKRYIALADKYIKQLEKELGPDRTTADANLREAYEQAKQFRLELTGMCMNTESEGERNDPEKESGSISQRSKQKSSSKNSVQAKSASSISHMSKARYVVRANSPGCTLCTSRGKTCITSDESVSRCDACKVAHKRCSLSETNQSTGQAEGDSDSSYAPPGSTCSKTAATSGTADDDDSDSPPRRRTRSMKVTSSETKSDESSDSPPRRKTHLMRLDTKEDRSPEMPPKRRTHSMRVPSPTMADGESSYSPPRKKVRSMKAPSSTADADDLSHGSPSTTETSAQPAVKDRGGSKVHGPDQIEELRRARDRLFEVLANHKEELGGVQSQAYRALYRAASSWRAEEDLVLEA